MVTRTSERIAGAPVALRRVGTLVAEWLPTVLLDGVRVGG
jgi:hypothetical protein